MSHIYQPLSLVSAKKRKKGRPTATLALSVSHNAGPPAARSFLSLSPDVVVWRLGPNGTA